MYKFFIRPIFFLINPETIHNILFFVLNRIQKCYLCKRIVQILLNVKSSKSLEVTTFGIKFPHPVGLAAGLDKNAEAIDALKFLGFSHIEIGTVTPEPQDGNLKPRLFRIKPDNALINRMGFNNLGTKRTIENIKKQKEKIIIGGNIGKNKITTNENAINDYEKAFLALYPYVDYFVVNVSSPNTPNLRELQDKEPLRKLLNKLKQLTKAQIKYKPVLLKISPDLNFEQIDDVIEIILDLGIDGIVATNTTISRKELSITEKTVEKIGDGGLSGKPLAKRSTEIIRYINKKSKGRIQIIGVGGILTAKDALEKIDAGASLVQLYTGFIYEGPALIKRINKALLERKNLPI